MGIYARRYNADGSQLLVASDTLHGGDGADTLDGGSGADWMDGGDGDDRYVVDSSGDVIGDASGHDVIEAKIDVDLADYTGVEDVELYGNLSAIGDGSANVLSGATDTEHYLFAGGGNDTLYGNSQHDELDGGSGADWMEGGDGSDLYHVDDIGDHIFDSSGVNDEIISAIDIDISNYYGVEHVYLIDTANVAVGDGADNSLYGNYTAANTLEGKDGDDSLIGGHGADTLDGGAGADHMEGGYGSDLYIVDHSLDFVVDPVQATSILHDFSSTPANWSSLDGNALPTR